MLLIIILLMFFLKLAKQNQDIIWCE